MVNFEAFPMIIPALPSKADTSDAALFKKLTWQMGEFSLFMDPLRSETVSMAIS
jgi:hypothetical protein